VLPRTAASVMISAGSGEVLAAPGVTEDLVHAASLRNPVPSATWARAAAPVPAPDGVAVRAVLEWFTAFGRYVHDDTDGPLRGLAWILAQDRSAAATELIGRVALAAGRFLRVHGRLRTYRIHLGSGNILMEPDDAYLCVVPARDAITDPGIRNQIEPVTT
jgi:hypothetical protein